MQDIVRAGLLFAFYEKLLTDRQRKVMSFYLDDNYSLAEISEELDISRQGVHDIIKRTTQKLEDYEKKLSLCDKLHRNRKLASEAIEAARMNKIELAGEKIGEIVEG
ncbi:MAG: sigma factor-like helix-turn-helix DNA-binding protein [Clostridia bacterium]